MYILLVGRT